MSKKKIGIIGGGQLAKMLIESQPRHQYLVIDPQLDCSVTSLDCCHIKTNFHDYGALRKLNKETDIITYEFENISSVALQTIQNKLRPNAESLKISQDRILEKKMANDLQIPTCEYYQIDSLKSLKKSFQKTNNLKWILKTTRGGYDGKGQIAIDLNNLQWKQIEEKLKFFDFPLILEKKVNFKYETSIIMHRNVQDKIVCLPPVKNFHHQGILSVSHNLDKIDWTEKMINYTQKIMRHLNMIGTLTVEFFITDKGPLFNEMAPRVHNSGHWSIEGATTSQFANHINAITDQKLMNPQTKAYTCMINLIGQQIQIAKNKALFNHSIVLHDYSKKEIRDKRKMGHITIFHSQKDYVLAKWKKITQILESKNYV